MIHITVSEVELNRFVNAARLAGYSWPEWVRATLGREAKREENDHPTTT